MLRCVGQLLGIIGEAAVVVGEDDDGLTCLDKDLLPEGQRWNDRGKEDVCGRCQKPAFPL